MMKRERIKKIAFCRYETYCLFKGPTLPGKPATKRFNELVSLH